MPFVSEAQRKFLWSQHPSVAREFASATPKGAKLPEHAPVKHAASDVTDDLLYRTLASPGSLVEKAAKLGVTPEEMEHLLNAANERADADMGVKPQHPARSLPRDATVEQRAIQHVQAAGANGIKVRDLRSNLRNQQQRTPAGQPNMVDSTIARLHSRGGIRLFRWRTPTGQTATVAYHGDLPVEQLTKPPHATEVPVGANSVRGPGRPFATPEQRVLQHTQVAGAAGIRSSDLLNKMTLDKFGFRRVLDTLHHQGKIHLVDYSAALPRSKGGGFRGGKFGVSTRVYHGDIPHDQIVIPEGGKLRERPQRMQRRYARIPQGKHGTPDWNPGNPTPEMVERRKTDPLWQAHRGLIDYSGDTLQPPYHGDYRPGNWISVHPRQVINGHQEQTLNENPDRSIQLPEGFGYWADAPNHYLRPNVEETGAAEQLHGTGPTSDFPHTIANPRSPVFQTAGGAYHQALFPLQDMGMFAKRGDPYRIWAASILGGNRHAIPHLVALLRDRDNPAGWWKGWSDLHRRMEREQGDLAPHQVADRLHKIAQATETESSDPMGHQQIAKTAYDFSHGNHPNNHSGAPSSEWGPQWEPYRVLADHMEENRLPHYAALVRSELANVIPDMQRKPSGNRRFARKRKKRSKLRMKNTVLQPWQTGGGSCSYARDDDDTDELRMVDSQILSYVRSGRVIPRNLLMLAVTLRQRMEELGMDTTLLPIPYKRRYAAHDDPTGMMPTRRAGTGEMDAPVYSPHKTPVVTSYLKHYTDIARSGTKSVPGKRMSVFVVHRNHKPVSFAVSSEQHEPYSVNGLDHVLHSTWENGRAIAGNPFSGHPRAETGERMARKYAADEDIPFAEVVGPHDPFEGGVSRAMPHIPDPYRGTTDERRVGDAPWNRGGLDPASATREGHAVKVAMRSMEGIPVDHPRLGGETFKRHAEAMANVMRTSPNSLPVHDYIREAIRAGEPRYDQGRMVNAAKRLLMVARSDPKNAHLGLFQRFADAEDKDRAPQAPIGSPSEAQAGTGTVAESGTPTYHDVDPPPEPVAKAPPVDDWAGGRKRGPREAPVVATKPGRGKKDVAARTGFMDFLHAKGVPDTEAISELGLQHMISPQQAKRMWINFKKSKTMQKQRMSRVLQIVQRMRGVS